MNVSSILKNVWFEFDTKFPSFKGRKDYVEKKFAFILQELNYYDGVSVDFPKITEPKFQEKRITEPSAMGFNIYNILEQLPNNRYANAVRFVRVLESKDIDASVSIEEHNYVGLPHEKELITKLEALNLERLDEIDIDTAWEFAQNLEDEFLILDPIPVELDRRFVKFWAPGPFKAFSQLIDNNKQLFDIPKLLTEGLLSQHVSIDASDEQLAFRELYTVLGIRVGHFLPQNELPAQIGHQKATKLIRSIMNCILNRRNKLVLPVDLQRLSIPVLVECIMWKVLVPIYVIHPDTVIDIDNYLAKYLLPAMPGANIAAYSFDDLQARYRQQNYLELNLRNGMLRGPHATLYAQFLRTSATGNGWGAPNASAVGAPRHADIFMNRSDIWYTPITGRELKHEMEESVQYTRFRDTVRTFSMPSGQLNFVGAHRDYGQPIMKMLQYLSTYGETWSQAVYYFDKAIKRISLMSIFNVVKPTDLNIGDVERIDIAIGSAISVPILIKGASIRVIGFDLKYIFAGWAVNEWANEVVAMWHIISDRFKSPFFTKADRLAKLVSSIRIDVGLNSIFRERIVSTPLIHTISIPDRKMVRDTFQRKITMVENAIDQYSHLYGLYQSLTFGTKTELHKSETFERIPKSANYVHKVDWNQLERYIQTGEIGNLITDGRVGNNTIFQIPVTAEMLYTVDHYEETPVIDFTHIVDHMGASWGSVKIPFHYKEDHILRDPRKRLNDRPVEWTVDRPPLIDKDESLIPDIIFRLKTFKKGFVLYDQFSFKSRI